MLTIITVCYNSRELIVPTIESVLAQKVVDFEHVFVDGRSTDGTFDVIGSHEARYASRGIRLKMLSEPDRGIQDAYNKAIGLSQGEWLVFINSGDLLASENVVAEFQALGSLLETADVCYGAVELVNHRTGQHRVVRYPEMIGLPFLLETTLCHQAVFFRKVLFDELGGYETNFRIASDFDRLLVFQLAGKVFLRIPTVVGVFVDDGVSSQRFVSTMRERVRIIRKRLGRLTLRTRAHHVVLTARIFARRVLDRIFH